MHFVGLLIKILGDKISVHCILQKTFFKEKNGIKKLNPALGKNIDRLQLPTNRCPIITVCHSATVYDPFMPHNEYVAYEVRLNIYRLNFIFYSLAPPTTGY